jgi:hypothetical protein
MAPKPRVHYAGARYHVVNRGDRRDAILADEAVLAGDEPGSGRVQMHVIAGGLLASLSQRLEPVLAIHVIMEDALLPISPVHDVINASWMLNSQRPWHVPSLMQSKAASSLMMRWAGA